MRRYPRTIPGPFRDQIAESSPRRTLSTQKKFMQSSRIRVDLLTYESIPTDRQEQYDFRTEKNLDGHCQVWICFFGWDLECSGADAGNTTSTQHSLTNSELSSKAGLSYTCITRYAMTPPLRREIITRKTVPSLCILKCYIIIDLLELFNNISLQT